MIDKMQEQFHTRSAGATTLGRVRPSADLRLAAFSRPGLWLAGLALTALLLTACAAGATPMQTLQLGAAPWSSGEVARYAVTSEGAPAGTATFSAELRSDPATGQPAGWVLRRDLEGRGDQEIVVMTLGPQGYRPIDSTLVRILTGGTEQVKALYNGSEVNLELTSRNNVLTYEQLSMPSDVRESRSLPWLVRTLPLEAGYATRLNTLLPITGLLDRVAMTVGRPESITVPAGVFEAYRITLDTGDSLSRAWVAVEAPHAVVKFEDDRANATFELAEFTPGGEE